MSGMKNKKNLTYDEWELELYKRCKEYAVCQAYPEDFEKLFKEEKENGKLKKAYERGNTPDEHAYYIGLMV